MAEPECRCIGSRMAQTAILEMLARLGARNATALERVRDLLNAGPAVAALRARNQHLKHGGGGGASNSNTNGKESRPPSLADCLGALLLSHVPKAGGHKEAVSARTAHGNFSGLERRRLRLAEMHLIPLRCARQAALARLSGEWEAYARATPPRELVRSFLRLGAATAAASTTTTATTASAASASAASASAPAAYAAAQTEAAAMASGSGGGGGLLGSAAGRFALHWTFGISGRGKGSPFWRVRRPATATQPSHHIGLVLRIAVCSTRSVLSRPLT